MFQHISCGYNQWFSCMKFPVAMLKSLLFHAWTMHDSWNMHVTGRDLGHFTGRYHACYKHELLPDISCMFHGWNLADFMKHACIKPYSMCGTSVFHAWYWHIPCVVQAYSMRGTGVFHAWYRRIPCMVLAYSMRVYRAWYGYSHACTMYSTGSCTI